MAIATLAKVFNNPEVLRKNVKIRKGTTCDLILNSRTLKGCVDIFQYYLRDMKQRLPVEDPNYLKFNIQVAKIEQFIEEMFQDNLPAGVEPRETMIYLKVQERLKWDTQVIPRVQEEDYKFNMALSVVFCVLLSFYFFTKWRVSVTEC